MAPSSKIDRFREVRSFFEIYNMEMCQPVTLINDTKEVVDNSNGSSYTEKLDLFDAISDN